MTVQVAGPIGPFLDSVQQRQVECEVVATCEVVPPGLASEQRAQVELLRAIRELTASKTASDTLQFKDLSEGADRIVPEVIAASGLAQQGISVDNLVMTFGVDGRPPKRWNLSGSSKGAAPAAANAGVNLRVGGFNIKAGTGGVDTAGLARQVGERVKSTQWRGEVQLHSRDGQHARELVDSCTGSLGLMKEDDLSTRETAGRRHHDALRRLRRDRAGRRVDRGRAGRDRENAAAAVAEAACPRAAQHWTAVRVGGACLADRAGTALSYRIDARHVRQNMWITNRYSNNVTKLSPPGVTLGTFAVGTNPAGIAFDGTHMGVANSADNDVTAL